jgi:SAM-dependent methyltransferase
MPARTENPNNDFFDGYYKEIWRALTPEGLTKAETNFLVEYNGLAAGDKVLDLMCGYGRNAIALARLGIKVTAVDNLKAYIDEIREVVEKEDLPVTVIQADVLELTIVPGYDLAICLGNSISFFNYEDTMSLLSTLASGLKTGRRFIINTTMLKEIVGNHYPETSSYEIGGLKFSAISKTLTRPDRIESETSIITGDGIIETKKAIDYIFSLDELEQMFNANGLRTVNIWSVPGKKKFTTGEPRAYIVTEKI